MTAVSGEDVAESESDQASYGSSSNLAGSQSNGGEASEVARFGAVKEKKHSLESGISVFNRYAFHVQLVGFQVVSKPWCPDDRHVEAHVPVDGRSHTMFLR